MYIMIMCFLLCFISCITLLPLFCMPYYCFMGYRVERHLTKDVVIQGVKLPEGGIVNACIYAVHHDPETWPDPFKFDPER